jgi:hypothetical protein
MEELAGLINSMNASEAYSLGRLRDDLPDCVKVVTSDKVERARLKNPAVIARSQEYVIFKEGEPGLALIDIDFKGAPAEIRQRLIDNGGAWATLCEVLPALKNVPRVERASTSSGLRNSITGETYPGSGGQHIVIPVSDAADIPHFLANLHERLWLEDLGWGISTTAGSFLERGLIDKSVGTPERLIFEGPPIIEPPLVQEPRNAIVCRG